MHQGNDLELLKLRLSYFLALSFASDQPLTKVILHFKKGDICQSVHLASITVPFLLQQTPSILYALYSSRRRKAEPKKYCELSKEKEKKLLRFELCNLVKKSILSPYLFSLKKELVKQDPLFYPFEPDPTIEPSVVCLEKKKYRLFYIEERLWFHTGKK